MRFDIPDPVGWALMERATRLGLDVDVVVAAALSDVGEMAARTRRPYTEPVEAAIGRLVDEGLCDADIAAETHYLVAWVATVRRRLGKPANRRYARAKPD